MHKRNTKLAQNSPEPLTQWKIFVLFYIYTIPQVAMPSQLPHFLVLFRCFWSSVAVQWIAWKDCLRNGPWNRTNSTQLDWLGARRLCTTLSAEEGNQPRVISLSLSTYVCVWYEPRHFNTDTQSSQLQSLTGTAATPILIHFGNPRGGHFQS